MSIVKNIPNTITCCNLICGCIATGAAFHHNFTTAFIFIMLGAVFDFFDGLSARALGVSSELGLQLDSLSDCVTFGVAPSSMLFTLFTYVRYPMFMYNDFWFTILPFTAFIMAAFSALRLAKYNIDNRQRGSFIGLPTPANAILWASLLSCNEAFFVSHRFNCLFLLAFIILSSWLMVSEIPMFALKFKNKSWKDNSVKYIYIILVILILILCLSGTFGGKDFFTRLTAGISASIGLYIIMSILNSLIPQKG